MPDRLLFGDRAQPMSQHCERWRRDAYKAGFSQKPASLLPLRCCGKCFANETYRRIAFFELGQNVASLIKETSHETCWEKTKSRRSVHWAWFCNPRDPRFPRFLLYEKTLKSMIDHDPRNISKPISRTSSLQ